MAEEGPGCPWVLLRYCKKMLRVLCYSAVLGTILFCCFRCPCIYQQHPQQNEAPALDVAELQLNRTGPRKELALLWEAGPALGRSFLHGPELDQGQLRVQRDGIYRLHIQVTLANCSRVRSTAPREATLAVGICSPVTHSVSLLRVPFSQGCAVFSQGQKYLARGDVLCTNLTLPLLPSPNADETFFGVQWIRP